MAKVILGPTIGMASGSIGATVFSRNRYGTYIRRRATPTVSTTEWAMAAKNRLTTITQAWQGKSAGEQLTWNQWAVQNPVVGSLGQPQALTGHAAFVRLNTRLSLAGQTLLTDPPIIPAPAGLLTCSVVPNKTLGTCEITFTATPLAANEALWIKGCYVESKGIEYVQNHLRHAGVSAAAEASPFDAYTLITDRLGTMTIGTRVVLNVSVFNFATGQLSSPLRCFGWVV